MATKIDVPDVGRSDLFHLYPQHINVDDLLNGRFQPHDEADIDRMVKSFEVHKQRTPVEVRKVADNKVQLVSGYRRYNAALKYNQLHPDNPMKLACIASKMSDEEAFTRNIVENHERKDTSPVDDAFNHRRLRDNFGWTDARIADLYGCTQAYICQLNRVLTLPAETQHLLHKGELSLQAALALADLSVAEQSEVLAEVKAEEAVEAAPVADLMPPVESAPEQPAKRGRKKGSKNAKKKAKGKNSKKKISTRKVLKKVRKRKNTRGQKQARSMSEVREFFSSLAGLAGENPKVKALGEFVLAFVGGSISEAEAIQKANALFDDPTSPEPTSEVTAPEPVEATPIVETPTETTNVPVAAA